MGENGRQISECGRECFGLFATLGLYLSVYKALLNTNQALHDLTPPGASP